MLVIRSVTEVPAVSASPSATSTHSNLAGGGDLGRAELARALGLGGRVRRAGSDVERARQNVNRAITSVLRKLEGECPRIGRHLKNCVRTGVFCVYTPDPGYRVQWETE